MAESISIARPDDWHAHFRDGDLMASVVGATARQFARAIVMPNLKPPVTTTKQAKVYRERILGALPTGAPSFVERAPATVAATITAHHLLMNRNALFAGGFRPHHYCLPVLKREPHRRALVKAATSGNPKYFLGSDSAPHARHAKETDCGAAGLYTAHAALELYAEAFDNAGALARLDAFASHFGADFYGLPRNKGEVKLEKVKWKVPAEYPFGAETVVPLRAGQRTGWGS